MVRLRAALYLYTKPIVNRNIYYILVCHLSSYIRVSLPVGHVDL